MPGASFDDSLISQESPVYGLDAATDPVAVAGPCGYVYVIFMGFTRGGQSKIVVARFQDLNDSESGKTWQYQGTTVARDRKQCPERLFSRQRPHQSRRLQGRGRFQYIWKSISRTPSAVTGSLRAIAPSTASTRKASSRARSTSRCQWTGARPGTSRRSSSPTPRTRAPSSPSIRGREHPRPPAAAATGRADNRRFHCQPRPPARVLQRLPGGGRA